MPFSLGPRPNSDSDSSIDLVSLCPRPQSSSDSDGSPGFAFPPRPHSDTNSDAESEPDGEIEQHIELWDDREPSPEVSNEWYRVGYS